jgi:hypothetical protein
LRRAVGFRLERAGFHRFFWGGVLAGWPGAWKSNAPRQALWKGARAQGVKPCMVSAKDTG